MLTEAGNPGVPISSGPITVTGPTLETITPLGIIECEEVMLNGDVTSSAGDTTRAHGTAGSIASGCRFEPGGQPETISEINIGEIESVGMETTVPLSYAAEIQAGATTITCEFETPEPSPIEVAIFLESELCGESELVGETTWETKDGTPLIFSEG